MLPRHVTPAAAARRSWLVDAVLGILLGIVAIAIAAGIGVVGFLALLAAIPLAAWYLGERILRARSRRGRR